MCGYLGPTVNGPWESSSLQQKIRVRQALKWQECIVNVWPAWRLIILDFFWLFFHHCNGHENFPSSSCKGRQGSSLSTESTMNITCNTYVESATSPPVQASPSHFTGLVDKTGSRYLINSPEPSSLNPTGKTAMLCTCHMKKRRVVMAIALSTCSFVHWETCTCCGNRGNYSTFRGKVLAGVTYC